MLYNIERYTITLRIQHNLYSKILCNFGVLTKTGNYIFYYAIDDVLQSK